MPNKKSQIGELPPLYSFFLNPYDDARFTRCPQCERKTGQKKVPLVIHVDPHHPVSLNYTCRYCKHCDLLIAHQDEIERLLAGVFSQLAPEVVGNEYLVIGTFDRAYWKEGLETPHDSADLLANLHGFKQRLEFEQVGGWVFDDPAPEAESSAPPARRQIESPPIPSKTTIDDLDEALALVEKMKASLPITVQPTKALVRLIREQGAHVNRNQLIQIHDVLYTGDEGGIMCNITPTRESKEVILCSLTQLEIIGHSPLEKEMRAYQRKRSARLARSQSGGPFGLVIEPRSKKH